MHKGTLQQCDKVKENDKNFSFSTLCLCAFAALYLNYYKEGGLP